MLPHPLAPVSTRSLAGYCDKRITRSSLPASVRRVSLDECERKLVILNRILRLSFLSVGCLRLRKLLQRMFSLFDRCFPFSFFFFFFSSFHSFRRRKFRWCYQLTILIILACLWKSRLTPIFRKKSI